MKKLGMKNKDLLLTFILLFTSVMTSVTVMAANKKTAQSNAKEATSILRISCDGEDVGAEVQLNGKFRGECPVDIQVTEGQYKLQVVKKIDEIYEKAYEQDIRIAEGNVKKIVVVLNQRMTKQGEEIQAQRDALEDAQRKAEEQARLDTALAADKLKQQKLAEIKENAGKGDVDAMVKYAAKLARDNNKFTPESLVLLKKASDNGSEIANYFVTADSPDFDDIAFLETDAQPARIVNITGSAELKKFINNEPVFNVPSNSGVRKDYTEYYLDASCSKTNGNFFRQKGEEKLERWRNFEQESFMGGLFTYSINREKLFMLGYQNLRTDLQKIKSIRGGLFPQKSKNVFEMTSVYSYDLNTFSREITTFCRFVTNDEAKCIEHIKYDNNAILWSQKNYSWDKQSGCFIATGFHLY